MGRKLTREETRKRLNELFSLPSTAEALTEIRAELESTSIARPKLKPRVQAAIRLGEAIDPQLDRRQFWLVFEYVDRLLDLGIATKSKGRLPALTDDEGAIARRRFNESKAAGNTDNAAVDDAIEEVNRSRPANGPAKKSSIERAVGVRQK